MTAMILYHATHPDITHGPLVSRADAGVAPFQWDNKASTQLYACLRKSRAALLGYAAALSEAGVIVHKVESRGGQAYLHLTSSKPDQDVIDSVLGVRVFTLNAGTDTDWKLWNVLHGEYNRLTPIADAEIITSQVWSLARLRQDYHLHFLPA